VKKLYATLLYILSLHLTLQAQWVEINPPGNGDNYTSVVFPTKDTGYAVGLGGSIIKTTDGGNNWTLQLQLPSIAGPIWDVCFTDANTGFAVGGGSIKLKTTNGGIKWDTIPTLPALTYISVCFPTKNTGYILPMSDTSTYKTTDGGNTWIKQPNLISGSAANGAIYFTDSLTGYVASGGIAKTTDGGNSWVMQDSSGYYGSTEYFTSICFSAPDTGYAVAYYGSIYKTVNGGNHWIKQVTGTSPHTSLYSVFFTSTNVGYAAGGDAINGAPNRIFKTTDGGANWVQQTTPSNNMDLLFSLFFTKPDTGYALGIGGTILKTVNGGFTDINQIHSLNSTITIYPNPVQNTLNIKAETYDTYNYKIVNTLGEFILQGTCQQNINVNTLPKGIYFLQLYQQNKLMYSNKFLKE